MPRTSTLYASAYQRTRETVIRLARGEERTLAANFNGLLDPGEAIATATFRVQQPGSGILSSPAIASDGRSCSCTLLTGYGGMARLRIEIETSTGRTLIALARLDIQGAPHFAGEANPAQGPTSVTVSA